MPSRRRRRRGATRARRARRRPPRRSPRSTLLFRRAAGEGDIAPRPLPQLGVVRHDADHQTAVRAAEPNHRHRRDRVEDELLGRAGLEASRARDHLRADDGRHLVLGDVARGASVRTGDGDGERAARPGRLEGGEHERRPARRADGDDAILGLERELAQRGRRRCAVVLARLALSHDGDDLARRRAEGRAALGRVEPASAPEVPAPTYTSRPPRPAARRSRR